MKKFENDAAKIIATVLEVSVDSLHAESSPETIPAWDSLRHMKLVLALEDHFRVEFTEEEVVEMLSFELVLLTLASHL